MTALVRAEYRKLKRTPTGYLIPFLLMVVLGLVLLAHSLDVHRLSRLGANPWPRFLQTTMISYTMLVVSPLCVLLVSGVLYAEQKADAWKYLYALPVSRGKIYLAKLLLLVGLFTLATLLYCLGVGLTGWLLAVFFPEYELAYHPPDFYFLLDAAVKCVISVLGIIGLQYLVGLWFRNFLIPLSIGFFGIISGFLLSTTSLVAMRFFPFVSPYITQDFNVANPAFSVEGFLGLNAGMLGSLVCFVCCTVLGYWHETRLQVK